MDAKQKNLDNDVPLQKKLDDLYDLIDGIETAMFTTRRPDGHLVSRPLQTQQRAAGADLWFVTGLDAQVITDLYGDPHVNVAYFRDRTKEWVSVSGIASVTQNREIIRELYKPDWRAWFADEGGKRDGGPEDPRIALLLVEAHSVTYLKKDRPAPVVLFAIARAMVTGNPPKVGDQRELGEQELRVATHRDQAGDAGEARP